MRASHLNKTVKIFFSAIIILVIIILLFPLIWTIPAMFMDKTEIFGLPLKWLPDKFTFDNFKLIFGLSDMSFLGSMLSTLGVATTSVVLSLTVNMLAAYAFARIDFPGKNIFWIYVLITMFIPGITILLTSVRVVSALGMLDTFWVLVIPGLASAYNVFFFRQFYLGFPEYLEEAAVIDGSSKMGIFLKIFLPMSVTPMIIIGASVFMGYWNSFLWPTMTISDNGALRQIMQVIRTLNSRYRTNYGVVVAATCLSLIIPLAVFAVVQKQIVQGISISGLK